MLASTCGISGSFLYKGKLLRSFGLVNITLFLLTGSELLMTYVTWRDCEYGTNLFPKSPFTYICNPSVLDYYYWVPTIIALYINVFSAFFGCLFSQKIHYIENPPKEL